MYPNARYQVFLSSTFKDLETERKTLIEHIINGHHIPEGMELFDPDDIEQWNIIQKTIDLSDVYLLIIGHRYGSPTKFKGKDVSYTEKEFLYALERKKKGVLKMLVFIRKRDAVNLSIIDPDKGATKALDQFITSVKSPQNKLTVREWTDVSDLSTKVIGALNNAINNFPKDNTFGWVKKSSIITPANVILNESLINNCEVIYKHLEQTANIAKTSNDEEEEYLVDKKGNCTIIRTRKMVAISEFGHCLLQYQPDKMGKNKVEEIFEITSNRLFSQLNFVTVPDKYAYTLYVMFGRVINSGEFITYKTKVRVEGYIHDLIKKDVGYVTYSNLSGTRFSQLTHKYVFDDAPIFDKLKVTLVQIYANELINEECFPTVDVAGKKTYLIKLGQIDRDCEIIIEFKKNTS